MRFSFITCTFNRANNLSRTLDSLVKQVYDANKFEILIVNNNSTDHTAKICEQFIEQYSSLNIRSVIETNQGLSFALNRGIKEAKGEYIIYIDDDETIEVEHLSRLDSYLNENPQIAFAGSAVIPVYEGEEPKWMSRFLQRLMGGAFGQNKTKVELLSASSYPGTGHTIIKRALYDVYGNYNTELGRKGAALMGAEDKDLSIRLIQAGVKCYFLPNIPIYHHIPAYKLTDEFFNKLTYSIGKSERLRTKALSEKAFRKRLFDEVIKWGASFILFFFYLFTFRISKGEKLLLFRYNVTKGLLAK